jgi:hypothetical protein
VDLVVGSESRGSRVEIRVEEVCCCACMDVGVVYFWQVDWSADAIDATSQALGTLRIRKIQVLSLRPLTIKQL